MNLQGLLQQAQKAQKEMQEKLSQLEVEGKAGGGLVIIRLNGLKELVSVRFTTDALEQGDPELLAEMVMVAWEEAAREAEKKAQGLLAKLGLPGGMF